MPQRKTAIMLQTAAIAARSLASLFVAHKPFKCLFSQVALRGVEHQGSAGMKDASAGVVSGIALLNSVLTESSWHRHGLVGAKYGSSRNICDGVPRLLK